MKTKILSLFFVLLIPPSLMAQTACTAWSETQSYGDLYISDINLNVQNIFHEGDTKENKRFHDHANKWHFKTKDSIVSRELLFKQGDILDIRVLHESERILRSNPYIKDVVIVPVKVCGDQVTVNVTTTDNWTLTPGFSYGSSGGRTKYAVELQEKNLLGYGKDLEFKYKKGYERVQKSIKYNDRNLWGKRRQLEIIYENNSDGQLSYFNLSKPFFSLDTLSAWSLTYFDQERINPIYQTGSIVDEIGQKRKYFSSNFGKLTKRSSNDLHRFALGFTSDENHFFNSSNYSASELPENRKYDYPWLNYEYFKENYIQRVNFNSMDREEDISLGHHFKAQIGRSFNNSATVFDVTYNKGLYNTTKNLFLFNSYFKGNYQQSDFIDSYIGAELKWFHFQSPRKTLYASLNLQKAKNMFAEKRQYLGGETGLRGYPFRYLQGENKFVFTLEQRYFYKWYPLKTFQFGSAIFVDSGAAWDSGETSNPLTNVGFGIRLVPTRTSSGKVIHMDFAFPVNGRENIDGYQIVLRTKNSF